MTVAEKLETLKDIITELESEYCENCQEWDCDYCNAEAENAVPMQVNLPDDWVEQIVNRLRNDPEAEWAKIIRCRYCKY